MHINIIAFAVPFFTGLIYLEYYLCKRKGMAANFQFNETVANLNVGIAERLSDIFATGLFYFFFSWIYYKYSIFNIAPGFITWLLLFLATDFLWYWYHRFGHEVNLFWSVHVVHHQSDDYNFSVSARITIFQAAARCLFWSFLPLIGFPPEMITVLLLIHGAYPFFTHTQLIGKLGWFEYFLVTPSHHRVHHSSNPEYLDKNYGDVLIIWDKMLGTFAEEKERPVYGLTKPLNSYSFLWQQFHFMLEMGVAFKRVKGLRAKLKVIFGRPDDIDSDIRSELEKKLSFRQRKRNIPASLSRYIKAQTIICLVVLFLTILLEHYLNIGQLLTLSGIILLSVINTGAMLEQQHWIFHTEFVRALLCGIFCWLTFPHFSLTTFLLGIALVILLFYNTFKSRYEAYLYGCNQAG